jgi:hypothetical protein
MDAVRAEFRQTTSAPASADAPRAEQEYYDDDYFDSDDEQGTSQGQLL